MYIFSVIGKKARKARRETTIETRLSLETDSSNEYSLSSNEYLLYYIILVLTIHQRVQTILSILEKAIKKKKLIYKILFIILDIYTILVMYL